MIGGEEGFAWLSRSDGQVVVGYGPFRESGFPPGDGFAFFKRSFVDAGAMAWKVPAKGEVLEMGEFRRRFGGEFELEIEWDVPDAIPFSEVFQEVSDWIRAGIVEKTVPVVTELGRVVGGGPSGIVKAMAGQGLPLHSYGWVEGGRGFAGATPELLFSLEGQRLETMALAGTAREEDLSVFSVDEKEIREHEYVAQTLVAKLVDLGVLERRARDVLQLGSIVHFHTGISVFLDTPMGPDALIRRLHPTPALGPLPRTVETMEKLGEWRERLGCPQEFGAPFGVWDGGKFEAVVAIRGMWWDGGEVQLPAGCGVIEASRLVNEWRELRLKRDAVKGFLGGAIRG